jgi:CRP-like cAMP-binding protein
MPNFNVDLPRLRKHHLFSALADAQFERILAVTQLMQLAPHQLLFQRGDPARHFFVVLDGQVKICLQSRGGDEKVVERIDAGHGFAEAVMFMEAPQYPVAAIAIEPSLVAAVPNADFLSILRENTETCLRLLADLSRRLHAHIRQIENLALENATNRVARHLVDLAGADAAGQATVRLGESKQLLASRLAIKPETLSRSLKSLVDAGVIAVQGRSIDIRDLARLRHWQ